MKFYELALIMLLVNVFGSALTNSGLFTAMGFTQEFAMPNPSANQIENMEQEVKSSFNDNVSPEDPADKLFSLVTEVVSRVATSFFNPLRKYILWPALILSFFGVPAGIGTAMTIVFDLVMVVGLVQFITGRGFKQNE